MDDENEPNELEELKKDESEDEANPPITIYAVLQSGGRPQSTLSSQDSSETTKPPWQRHVSL